MVIILIVLPLLILLQVPMISGGGCIRRAKLKDYKLMTSDKIYDKIYDEIINKFG